MERLILLFALINLPVLYLRSQSSLGHAEILTLSSEKKKEWLLGWQVGVNRSFIKNQTKFKLAKVNGYHVGLFARHFLNKPWAIETNLVYETKGAYSQGFEVTYGLKYLSLSVYPSLEFKPIHAFGGLYYSYLVKAEDDIPENWIIVGAMVAEDFKKNDLGLKTGLGIRFFKIFTLDFCYDHGIASVYDYPHTGATGHNKDILWRRNRSYSLTLKTVLKKIYLDRIKG